MLKVTTRSTSSRRATTVCRGGRSRGCGHGRDCSSRGQSVTEQQHSTWGLNDQGEAVDQGEVAVDLDAPDMDRLWQIICLEIERITSPGAATVNPVTSQQLAIPWHIPPTSCPGHVRC